MTRFSLPDLLAATGGQLQTTTKKFPENGVRVWTDTRTIEPGDFFLPLSGSNFDGHDYLETAFNAGALGAFVSAEKFAQHSEWQQWPNLITVSDPLLAYLALGRFHRQRVNPIVIGVAGSNGKTTTKEMLYSAFSGVRKTQRTLKNFNNEVGVSQTLLALEPDTDILIVEMAMRGPGEIALLAEHVLPHVALVLNIGPEHIEFFQTLDAIAQAECEIFSGLNVDKGIAVINGEDTLLMQTTKSLWTGCTETFQLSDATDIQTTSTLGTQFRYQNQPLTLQVAGQHNIANALAVFKVGEALGFSASQLAPGLARFEPVEGRGNRIALAGYTNAWVINDAYNANPDSMQAAIQMFLTAPADGMRRILVLGGMNELGNFSDQYHEELGQWLAVQSGLDKLFTVGEAGQLIAKYAREGDFLVVETANQDDLFDQIKQHVAPFDHTVLYLKASRSYGLETLAKKLAVVAAEAVTTT